MFLVNVNTQTLVDSVNIWNNVYSLSLVFQGKEERYAAWSVDNVLITSIEIVPSKVMFEFDNFDLKGLTPRARQVSERLVQLVQQSFPFEDRTGSASRTYGVGERQVNRTLRTFPAVLTDVPLDADAEAKFKASMREKHQDVTDDEVNSTWTDYCELVKQERERKAEQLRRSQLTADEAAKEWFEKMIVKDEILGTGKISILFLAADPTDQTRLRLGEEIREIQEKLQLAKLRENFELHQRFSVRPTDLSQALLDIQPQIAHFSGHGAPTGELCVENQAGETHPIQPDVLAALFEKFSNQINCVILNACYSEGQARAIANHISFVIGMNQAIGDKAAIAFAIGFYQAIGAGRTIEEAYELGCVQIRLQNIPEYLTPILIKKGQT